tara:strand:- start:1895 stop:4117 length:2223 start_codon:yes stop_codon:yes gene_type:complete
MSKDLNFRVSSALKDIIGRDLITDDYIAIFELVKNSYDAHASRVDIIFSDVTDRDKSKIIIKDNGKGMNFEDLSEKWLFVGYSAKKEGSEDKDYRDKIYQNRQYAGAKGIGRFSCDRLGKSLRLETTKVNEKTQQLLTNWESFEKNMREEFMNIKVIHSDLNKNSYGLKHGTILEISELRSKWDKEKLDYLKKSLSKLINPSEDKNKRPFNIFITCEEFAKSEEKIENFIFETLAIKTSKIEVEITEDGKKIITELKDGGTRIYRIEEHNSMKILSNIKVKVYYLNQSAKLTFSNRMGVNTKDYGSVYLYRNNIRIYPYGEPGEDPLKLDLRKAQKPSIYIGNKDIIGRIEITETTTDLFKESSSRGDGFQKNAAYSEFMKFYHENVIERLEKYVIDVQKWGDGNFLSIEDDLDNVSQDELKTKITDLITKITNSDEIVDLKYDPNFVNIISNNSSGSATSLVKNLYRLAKNSGNDKILDVANKTEKRVAELINAFKEVDEIAKKTTIELEEKVTENLFLKSVKSQDFDEVVSFLHHIGISAGIVDNYLTGLYNKVRKGEDLDNKKLIDILKIVVFENKKIQNISKFATKANFKLYTDAIEINLEEYLKEYVKNVVSIATNDGMKVSFLNHYNKSFIGKFRPIEINILVDNLFSNSKKAGATKFEIEMKQRDNKLVISFIDNGKGIDTEKLEDIFRYGYTTKTEGAGIGLYHVKEIVDRFGGELKVKSKLNKGTEFEIII